VNVDGNSISARKRCTFKAEIAGFAAHGDDLTSADKIEASR
jgi:hypothetical protein